MNRLPEDDYVLLNNELDYDCLENIPVDVVLLLPVFLLKRSNNL